MRTVAEYRGRYAGRRFTVVGRGPTPYAYESLRDLADPVIFINDAVQLEQFAGRSPETFFFAHDACQGTHLERGIRSTVVIPEAPLDGDRRKTRQRRLYAVEHPDWMGGHRVRTYKWGGRYWQKNRSLADVSADELARTQRLALCGGTSDPRYAGGTIHSAIHFAWLCGAREIAFIGCDGKGQDYDNRLENRSQGINFGVHDRIRAAADRMCQELGIDTLYVGCPQLANVIPRLAHVVWVGSGVPAWLNNICDEFERHNSQWALRIWQEMPAEAPEAVRRAAASARQICQVADVLYCWLLHEFGGVVMDVDSLTLRSLEPLRHRGEAWTTRHNDEHKRLTNGVMGGVRGNRAFRRCLDEIGNLAEHLDRNRSMWRRCMYGPDMLTRLFSNAGDQDMTVLPWHYFYPWRYSEREEAHRFWKAGAEERRAMLHRIHKRFTAGEWPYAVHLWGVDGSSQRPTREHANGEIQNSQVAQERQA